MDRRFLGPPDLAPPELEQARATRYMEEISKNGRLTCQPSSLRRTTISFQSVPVPRSLAFSFGAIARVVPTAMQFRDQFPH